MSDQRIKDTSDAFTNASPIKQEKTPVYDMIQKAKRFAAEVGSDVADVLRGWAEEGVDIAREAYDYVMQEDTSQHDITSFRDDEMKGNREGAKNTSPTGSGGGNRPHETADTLAGEVARGTKGPMLSRSMAAGGGEETMVASREIEGEEGDGRREQQEQIRRAQIDRQTKELEALDPKKSDSRVKAVQEKLDVQTDGKLGSATREAIFQWQKKNGPKYGIEPTGKLDEKTYKILTSEKKPSENTKVMADAFAGQIKDLQ